METLESFEACNKFIKDNVNLILINGKAHSGKGAIAKILRDKYGFIEVGFADYLKKIATDYFDWPHDLIYINGKRIPESRRFMQIIGEAGRLLTPDFWIRRLATKIYEVASNTTYETRPCQFVISDLRYPNEAEWGRLVGGQLWKVIRTGKFNEIEAGANHISETALSTFDQWDRVILNDSDLTALEAKIDNPFVTS